MIEDNMFIITNRVIIERSKLMQPSFCLVDERANPVAEDPELVVATASPHGIVPLLHPVPAAVERDQHREDAPDVQQEASGILLLSGERG